MAYLSVLLYLIILPRTDNRYYLLQYSFLANYIYTLVFLYRKINLFMKLRLISYESLLSREVLRAEFKLDTLYSMISRLISLN